MSKAIDLTLTFRAPVGTLGHVRLLLDAGCRSRAHLSIDMGYTISGTEASASLGCNDMHRLVDALLDCIYAIERAERLHSENPASDKDGGAVYG